MEYEKAIDIKDNLSFLIGREINFSKSKARLSEIDIVPSDQEEYEQYMLCSIINDDDLCLLRYKKSDLIVRFITHQSPISIYMTVDEFKECNPQHSERFQ